MVRMGEIGREMGPAKRTRSRLTEIDRAGGAPSRLVCDAAPTRAPKHHTRPLDDGDNLRRQLGSAVATAWRQATYVAPEPPAAQLRRRWRPRRPGLGLRLGLGVGLGLELAPSKPLDRAISPRSSATSSAAVGGPHLAPARSASPRPSAAPSEVASCSCLCVPRASEVASCGAVHGSGGAAPSGSETTQAWPSAVQRPSSRPRPATPGLIATTAHLS